MEVFVYFQRTVWVRKDIKDNRQCLLDPDSPGTLKGIFLLDKGERGTVTFLSLAEICGRGDK